MKFLTYETPMLNGVEKLALAFDYLAKPTPHNSIPREQDNDAKRIETREARGENCQYVIFNSDEFHYFVVKMGTLFSYYFDRETQVRLVKSGVVGYLWGATVVIDDLVPSGHVLLTADTREDAFSSEKSVMLAILGQDLEYIQPEVSER